MKRYDNIYDLFRGHESRLSERPTSRSWRRLEQRLDSRRPRSHGFDILRYLSLAAALLLLVVLVSVLSWTVRERKDWAAYNPHYQTQFIDTSETNAAAARYPASYVRLVGDTIPEGSPGKRLMPLHQGL